MPSDAPPDEITTSLFDKALENFSASSSLLSLTIPKSFKFKKLWLNNESNIGLLESYTCPFELFFSSLKINSSPVDITETFNLLYTSISSVPDAASCAISAELSNFPLFTTTSPFLKFSPIGLIFWFCFTFSLTITLSSNLLHFSCMTIVSTPSGNIAPV